MLAVGITLILRLTSNAEARVNAVLLQTEQCVDFRFAGRRSIAARLLMGRFLVIIEANPRASRTVPFTSKATGVPLAKAAARIMAGEKLADLGLPEDDRRLEHFSVKEAVMPFGRFPGADTVLGFEQNGLQQLQEIIAQNYNHPSVVNLCLRPDAICDGERQCKFYGSAPGAGVPQAVRGASPPTEKR